MKTAFIATCVVFLLCLAEPATAVSNRVFVSGSGMDAGTCPLATPCRSFAYAITQVAVGGEIIALDTAGYGPVTISQSISIFAAPGATAFVAASSGDAITINGGDSITLRGLALTSTGATYGVDFQGGVTLNVENCIINGFSTGILFFRFGDLSKPRVQVLNSVIRNNADGLWVINVGAGMPGGGPPPNLSYVTIANSSFTGNNIGLLASDNSRVVASDSVFAANANFGVNSAAGANDSVAQATLERCNISRNGTGAMAGGTGSMNLRGVLRISHCVITGNDIGMTNVLDGSNFSQISNGVLTNTIEGNTLDGGPSFTYAAK